MHSALNCMYIIGKTNLICLEIIDVLQGYFNENVFLFFGRIENIGMAGFLPAIKEFYIGDDTAFKIKDMPRIYIFFFTFDLNRITLIHDCDFNALSQIGLLAQMIEDFF